MDVLEAMGGLDFLGAEFLTWLWFVAEQRGGRVSLDEHTEIEVALVDRMVLESGRAETATSVALRGRQADLPEARTALRQGRMVTKAGLRIHMGGDDWRLTISAADLTLSGVRRLTPPGGEEDLPGDPVKNRLDQISDLTNIIDKLFAGFIRLRVSRRWDEDEVPRMRRWIAP